MGKKKANKNADKKNDNINKTPVAPVSDNTAKKTNASDQQPVKSSVQIEQLKTSGMTLRSHCKYLEIYKGMQLRSHATIEFKHLN